MSFDAIGGSVIATVIAAAILGLAAYVWQRIRKHDPTTPGLSSTPGSLQTTHSVPSLQPPLPLPPSFLPPAVPPSLLKPRPQSTVTPDTHDPCDADAEGYPTFLDVPRLGPPSPQVLPYAAPALITLEIAALHPLSRDAHAQARFVGRSVEWTSVIGSIEEGDECYQIRGYVAPDMRGGFLTLTFPYRRRAELEVLNEGQEISYRGQIRKATAVGVELVRVEFLHPPRS
jgi:hypothetical protein